MFRMFRIFRMFRSEDRPMSPLSQALHHARSIPFAAEKATPLYAYLSHTRVTPALSLASTAAAHSQRLAEKSRWMVSSLRFSEDAR